MMKYVTLELSMMKRENIALSPSHTHTHTHTFVRLDSSTSFFCIQDDEEEEEKDDDDDDDDDDEVSKEDDIEKELRQDSSNKGLTGRDIVEASLYAFQRKHNLVTPFHHIVTAMRDCEGNLVCSDVDVEE